MQTAPALGWIDDPEEKPSAGEKELKRLSEAGATDLKSRWCVGFEDAKKLSKEAKAAKKVAKAAEKA